MIAAASGSSPMPGPQVGDQTPRARRLSGRLRAEDDRQAQGVGEFTQRHDVVDEFHHGGAPRRERPDEVVLHVVHQQRRTCRIDLPGDVRAGEAGTIRHRVRVDGRQAHGGSLP
ncbi:hypothetical protein GCM10010320_28270 [Streptomyces caelestis]|jgi:hypothetical protein|nr:hypothetical protein GCM10010320_28270 [Streptomyces caelestis]